MIFYYKMVNNVITYLFSLYWDVIQKRFYFLY